MDKEDINTMLYALNLAAIHIEEEQAEMKDDWQGQSSAEYYESCREDLYKIKKLREKLEKQLEEYYD